MRKQHIWIVLILTALAVLANCKTRETKIAFETLVKGDAELLDDQDMNFAAIYKDMDLLIVADAMEAQQIADMLASERTGLRLEEVADIDYGEYLVVVAYFGAKPNNGFGITIEEISQIGHSVYVVIDTVESSGGDAIVTHPVHIIKVKKSDLLVRGRLSFVLWKDDKAILTREHFVP